MKNTLLLGFIGLSLALLPGLQGRGGHDDDRRDVRDRLEWRHDDDLRHDGGDHADDQRRDHDDRRRRRRRRW